MDTLSTENIYAKSYKKKKKTHVSDKTIVKGECPSLDENNIDTQLANNVTEGNVIMEKLQIEDEVQSVGTKINTGPTEDITEGGVTGKMKKKRKRILMAEIEAEVQCEMDARNLDEGNLTTKKPKIKDEVQKTGPTTMDIGSTENPAGKMKKKRKGKKPKLVGEVQKEMGARSTDNLDEENVGIEKPKVKDKLQILGVTQMNSGSIENLADGKVIIENPKTLDKAQSMDQNTMDTWHLAGNVAQGNVAGKRRKKRNKNKEKVNNEVHCEMDTRSTEYFAEGNATLNKPEIKDAVQSVTQTQMDTGSTDNVSEGNVIVKRIKYRKQTKKAKVKDEFSGRMDGGSTENLARVNVNIRIPETRDEVPSMGLKVLDAGSTENLTKGTLTFENPKIKVEGESMDKVAMDTGPAKYFTKAGKRKKKRRIHAQENVTIENPKVQDEIQSIDQAKMNMPTEDLSEGNVTVKRKMKRKGTKMAKVKDEFSGRMDAESTENLAEINANIRISETRDEVPSMGLKVVDAGSAENLTKGTLTFENPDNKDEGQIMDSGPAKDFTKARKRKKKRRLTRKATIVSEFPHVSRGGTMLNVHLSEGHPDFLVGEKVLSVNGSSQVSNEIILDEGRDHAEGRSAISTCNACTVKDTEVCLKMSPIASVRRKLLVLDINGLLADVVFPAPKHDKGDDIRFYGRAVFRRPFCGDFLKFCFQNFYVGIWSSRSKKIIDKVVSYLLGDQKDRLLFCWDMTHSTTTGFKTLENRHKPLVCKELRKIWEEDDPSLPWKKGDYNESNTLLLDDSPYKALLNPLHTAIFPHPYQYSDKNDNSLGPGGDLRVYLEGLLASENVQKYVEQHPFGQSPLSEQHISWEFYDRVLKQMAKDKTSLVET